MEVHIADSIETADSVSAVLTPHDQERNWQRRWDEVQGELDVISAPHMELMSGDAIHAAARRLQSFFIQAYHLKDALKADESAHGVSGSVVETAITQDPHLALLADLANLDKHFVLTQPSRSGQVPHVGPMRGVSAGAAGSGWHLEMTITHSNKRLDGLDVARAAVEAWRQQLAAWGEILGTEPPC